MSLPEPRLRTATQAALVAALIAGVTGCGGGDRLRSVAERTTPAERQAWFGSSLAEERGREHNRRAARAAHGRSPRVPARAAEATVTRVVDGDTVVLSGFGPSRLIGVDTPEVYGAVECYGRAASAFTRRTLRPGTGVRYLRGPDPIDRYGRDLVYVWLSDGRFLNGLLVRRGYAVPLTIPPNVDYAALFARMARRARARDRGLWSPHNCAGNADLRLRGSGRGSRSGRGLRFGAGAGGRGDRDCPDFSTQREAQRYFEARGGPASDSDRLDADHDGRACETLPAG